MTSSNTKGLTERLVEAEKQNELLSQRIRDVENERDHAMEQALQFSDILKKALNEIKSVGDLNALLKQKCDISDSVINEYKIKLANQQQSGSKSSENSFSDAEIRELYENLVSKTNELKLSKELNVKLMNDSKKTREDVQGMMEVLEGLEKQINLYSTREEEIQQLALSSKHKYDEAQRILNECLERDEKYKRFIAQLSAENQSLKNRRAVSSVTSAVESDTVDTNYATAGSGVLSEDLVEESESIDDNSDSEHTNSYLEDSQVSSIFINYEGNTVSLEEAVNLLGFDRFAPEEVLGQVLNLADDHGLISQPLYQSGLAKLLSYHYISLSVLQRSISDFIIDRFFAVLDANNTGYVNAHEIGCGLLLFCQGEEVNKADIAWALLLSLAEDLEEERPVDSQRPNAGDNDDQSVEDTVELYAVIQALSALHKAKSCLDPESAQKEPNLKSVADNKSITEIYRYWGRYNKHSGRGMKCSQRVGRKDFMRLFIITLSKLDSETLEPVHEDENEGDYNSEEDQEQEEQEEEEGTEDNNTEDDRSTAVRRGSQMLVDDSLRVETHSENDNDEEDEVDMYRNDELFPPSSVVLELRAAIAVLGLENYAADDMLETLGEVAVAGKLSEASWREWISRITDEASTSDTDTHLAHNLSSKIFSSFDSTGSGEIDFCNLATGLSFLCGGSPLEDKLMVSFTVVDRDSDGYIAAEEFLEMVHSVLLLVTNLSKMAMQKVVASGADLEDLSRAAAREGLAALSLTEDDNEISFEMISEISEDFLKLAAIY